MGKKSGVDWTDASWGPWRGCHWKDEGPRPPECQRCYAQRDMKRYGWDPTVVTRSKTTFQDPLKWREPLKVFVCSWSDFFHADADAWRGEAWDVMQEADHHTYIVPTKRPGNVMDRLPLDWGDGWPNVWLLVSAGTQESADRFIPELLKVPAVVRGVSAEPLLGPMDPWSWLETCAYCHLGVNCPFPECHNAFHGNGTRTLGIDWIICGTESGPNRRPMELGWARDLVAQCKEAGVACFVKQLPINGRVSHDPAEWPEDLRIREFPT
jgi:protein gp37